MSGNRVGTKLSRLIRERAYLSGSLPSLQIEVDELRGRLKVARKALRDATKRRQSIDAAIQELSAIEPSQIRSIRRTPRREGNRHGEFRRELVRVLKNARSPAWSSDLVRHMAKAFGLPMETPEQRERARHLVLRPLYAFKKKGAVERLPTGAINSEGLWRWCGN